MSNTTLRILQYNVNHGKDATLVPLLQDTRVHEFDILAIQEPWRNPLTTTSYNPQDAPFYLAYPPKPLSRVCVYINKRIHPNTWTVAHHSEDAQTVTIRYGPDKHQRTLQVHNIYNPSPSSYSSQDQGTLETLRNCLQVPADDHIVVGDFNLHHPLWSGLARPTQHAAADILLDIARNASLELVTKCGTETWRARGTYSTIDLSFISQDLGEKLIKCVTRPDIAQSSDHIPIETSLDLQTQSFETDRKRCWKRLDTGKLLERLRQATLPDLELMTRSQIDTYICELTQALTNGIDASVPWQKGSRYARSYWSPECAEAVRETRRKYYDMLRAATQESEELHRDARSRKVATIRKAKRKEFREYIAKATNTPQGVYRLAKWARLKAGRPRELPQLPQLVVKRRNERQELVTTKLDTLPKKLDALREKFFPPPKHADLTDIGSREYPVPLEIDEEIREEEIHEALQHVTNDKAPGPDQISNRVLKAAEEWLTPKLYKLFNATVRIGYHPKAWKSAITLALRKPNKDDYTLVGAYRPIALLNSMGKILELVMSRKLSKLAENNDLLPETQMGARKGRSTETALQLLTEQVHTIWNLPGKQRVATMLCMDISGAFDNVSHIRLLDNLRKRRIPDVIVRWVASFLRERTTTIKVFEGESVLFNTETGIPQGSPISPILFLFFIADLLDATNDIALRVSAIGFVDDIHVLTYGDSTERNCRTLERIHERCEEWANKHGAQFAPEKYELIHFAKRPKSFNMAVTLKIGQIQKVAMDNVRVLGVQVDTKLKWGPHLAKIAQKHASQSPAIDRISASTWGASFKMARLVYTSVVRPSITYGASVWYAPQGVVTSRKHVDRKLEVLQNKNLRRVLGAYRAVGSRILEKEAHVPPISTVLTAQVANAAKRRLTGKGAQVIRKACAAIRNGTVQRQNTRKPPKRTPGELVTSWLRKIVPKSTWDKEILQQVTTRSRKPYSWMKVIRDHTKKSWDKLWTAYLASIPLGTVRAPAQLPTTSYRPQVHLGASKATSSLITQIRTEKIGLNAFLADRHVPDKVAICTCERSRQTAKHILLFCPEYADERDSLYAAAGTKDYSKMLATPRGAKAAAQWLQRTGLLPQFNLGL
jgi:exonuclease III